MTRAAIFTLALWQTICRLAIPVTATIFAVFSTLGVVLHLTALLSFERGFPIDNEGLILRNLAINLLMGLSALTCLTAWWRRSTWRWPAVVFALLLLVSTGWRLVGFADLVSQPPLWLNIAWLTWALFLGYLALEFKSGRRRPAVKPS